MEVFVTFVSPAGEIIAADVKMAQVPRSGARIDFQHQQPVVIGVVRGPEKWTSTNGVTVILEPREETAGPN